MTLEVSFDLDLTEEAINSVKQVMSKMPGNAGQETLVKSLKYYAKLVIEVIITYDPPLDFEIDINIKNEHIYIISAHPEAIEEIIEKGYDTWYEFVDWVDSLDFGGGEWQDILQAATDLLNRDNRRRINDEFVNIRGGGFI